MPFQMNDTEQWSVQEAVNNLASCVSMGSALVTLVLPMGSRFRLPLPSCRLDELNLSWCFDFTEKHVQAAVAHLPDSITQLNLSGYRKNLQKTG